MNPNSLTCSQEAAASAQALALSWSAEVSEALALLAAATTLLGSERADVRQLIETASDRLGWCEPEGALLVLLGRQGVH